MNNIDKILLLIESYERKCLSFVKESRIKKINNKYRVISKKNKNLGTFDSKIKAKKRLQQVEYFKNKDTNNIDNKIKIDLRKIDDFSYSAIMRCLRQQCTKEQVIDFLKTFKKHFDNAVKNKLQKPEKVALQNTILKFNKNYYLLINKKLIKKASVERFRQITNGLFAGGAPSPDDVLQLKNNYNIKKIISLDESAGNRISRTCDMLEIKHIMLPLDGTRASLLNFFKHDLKKLLLSNGPTFVHCQAGKDRTGFAIALFKCKYMGISPEDAIEEAKSLGFGVGVDPEYINQFEKIIKECKPDKDINNADIVSNEREYISDNRSAFLDEVHQGSFAPYLSVTKQNPMDAVYNYINDQSPIRENYKIKDEIKIENKENNVVPQVGVFNNDAGGRGFGPVENYSGFFYD